MPVTLEAIDITLIALYFVGMAAVGIIFWARGGGDGGGQDEAESFFLAGRSMRWPAVGLSLFVSNVGSEHLLGLAGSASATGVACAYFEWSAALHLLLLGWLFAPVYLLRSTHKWRKDPIKKPVIVLAALGGYTLSEASDPPLRTGRTPALAAQGV